MAGVDEMYMENLDEWIFEENKVRKLLLRKTSYRSDKMNSEKSWNLSYGIAPYNVFDYNY